MRKWLDVPSLLMLLLATALLLLEASGAVAYRAGLHNAEPIGLVLFLLVLAVAICCGIEMIRRTHRLLKRDDRRGRSAMIMLVIAWLTWAVIYFVRPPPEEAYLRGLKQFAARVDVEASRSWQSRRPTTQRAAHILAGSWPTAVTELSPGNVVDTPEGLMLEWDFMRRSQATRAIFVGDTDYTEPPEHLNYLWVQVRPGLYAGILIGQ